MREDGFRCFVKPPPIQVTDIGAPDRVRCDLPFPTRLLEQRKEIIIECARFNLICIPRAAVVEISSARTLRNPVDVCPVALNLEILRNKNNLLLEVPLKRNTKRV